MRYLSAVISVPQNIDITKRYLKKWLLDTFVSEEKMDDSASASTDSNKDNLRELCENFLVWGGVSALLRVLSFVEQAAYLWHALFRVVDSIVVRLADTNSMALAESLILEEELRKEQGNTEEKQKKGEERGDKSHREKRKEKLTEEEIARARKRREMKKEKGKEKEKEKEDNKRDDDQVIWAAKGLLRKYDTLIQQSLVEYQQETGITASNTLLSEMNGCFFFLFVFVLTRAILFFLCST